MPCYLTETPLKSTIEETMGEEPKKINNKKKNK